MNPPTTEHKYHIEIPGRRGEPIDVRLKNPRRGTDHAYCTCGECGKRIVRGRTVKNKKIPISQELGTDGKKYPIAHRDDCLKAKEFKKGTKNLSFTSSPLF